MKVNNTTKRHFNKILSKLQGNWQYNFQIANIEFENNALITWAEVTDVKFKVKYNHKITIESIKDKETIRLILQENGLDLYRKGNVEGIEEKVFIAKGRITDVI